MVYWIKNATAQIIVGWNIVHFCKTLQKGLMKWFAKGPWPRKLKGRIVGRGPCSRPKIHMKKTIKRPN